MLLKPFDYRALRIIDLPSPPRNLQVIEIDASYAVLQWEEPASDGGTPILGYNLEKKDITRDDFIYVASVGASVRQYKVIRLFEGIDYQFRVYAENQVGVSLPCETLKSIKAKQPYGRYSWNILTNNISTKYLFSMNVFKSTALIIVFVWHFKRYFIIF